MRAIQVFAPLKQEGNCACVACPAGPGIFTGAVLKGYGGLYLTLQAYRELLRIRWEGSRLRDNPRLRSLHQLLWTKNLNFGVLFAPTVPPNRGDGYLISTDTSGGRRWRPRRIHRSTT